MDKKVILISISLPILQIIGSIISIRQAAAGFGAIAAGLGMVMALISMILVIITLVILRSKKLKWWHGILISVGSVLVAFGMFAIFGLLFQL